MTNISNEERERRRQAVEFARASLGLEGMIPNVACLEHARRFIEGEFDLNEFLLGLPPVVEAPARQGRVQRDGEGLCVICMVGGWAHNRKRRR